MSQHCREAAETTYLKGLKPFTGHETYVDNCHKAGVVYPLLAAQMFGMTMNHVMTHGTLSDSTFTTVRTLVCASFPRVPPAWEAQYKSFAETYLPGICQDWDIIHD